MAYIGWIIAAVVLGMLTYPFLQLIPNHHQKRQVAIRQAAMQKGINIQIRHPDLPASLATEYSAIANCVAYFRPGKNNLENTYTALRSNNQNEWFWLNEQRPPAAVMTKMLSAYQEIPVYCLAIEQGHAGTTLFLQDALPVEEIDNIELALNKLNTLISR